MPAPACKVYGFLKPCSEELAARLQEPLGIMGEDGLAVLSLTGGLLNIAYEGNYFPVEDFLAALQPELKAASQGKLDYIDMQAWTLSRYSFNGALISLSSRNLNDVLAYSGH